MEKVPTSFYVSSMESEKELNSIRGDDMKNAVLEKYHIGDRFTLDADPRAPGSCGDARKSYKRGEYEVIGLYPFYVLTECTHQTPMNEYKTKESFTYSDMYRISEGTYEYSKAIKTSYPDQK